MDTIQVRWEALTLLYGEFTQDSTHQILSALASFCKRYDNNILVCF